MAKAITVGVVGSVQAFSIATGGTPVGGWSSLSELHSDALITSDVASRRLVGRLAERAPSTDDGSIALLPDGRMRVAYTLRQGVTWHDGAPFTAQDLAFSYAIGGPAGIPTPLNEAVEHMAGVEAPDDRTFVVYYKEPYHLGATLGTAAFWPLPRHLLGEAYDRFVATRNAEEILNLPYWTSEYVHLGAFRLTRFDPGEGMTFAANDRYYLGRPKIDTVRVRIYGEQNTLFASMLAGDVDMIMDAALRAEIGSQLKQRWDASGDGILHLVQGSLSLLAPQMRPAMQTEPTIFDPRVRTALFQALDRETLSEGVNGGHRILAAWSILPSFDTHYEATRDTLRRFPYDPERSKALLREAGWTPGDGPVRHSVGGRVFRTAIWVSAGREHESAAYAAYWRQLGLEVDEAATPAAQARNQEYRASFPGWDLTGTDPMALLGTPPATTENRWSGNRPGYDDARAMSLVTAFRRGLSERDQVAAMRAFNDHLVDEMAFVPLYFAAQFVGARKGIQAFDDLAGGYAGNPLYGTYSRNAYLWDLR